MISSETYEEVYEILGYMDKLTVMKIPEHILKKIKDKRNINYKTKVNKEDIFNEKNVSKEAIDLLCWLDYNYWMDENKKREVDNICKEKYIKSEIKKRDKYNPEEMFKNKQINSTIELSEQSIDKVEMIEYKEQKWYQKIFAKILKLLRDSKSCK